MFDLLISFMLTESIKLSHGHKNKMHISWNLLHICGCLYEWCPNAIYKAGGYKVAGRVIKLIWRSIVEGGCIQNGIAWLSPITWMTKSRYFLCINNGNVASLAPSHGYHLNRKLFEFHTLTVELHYQTICFLQIMKFMRHIFWFSIISKHFNGAFLLS